jgi:hypothetical protein
MVVLNGIFSAIAFLSLVGLIIGLINPRLYTPLFKKISRKRLTAIFVALFLVATFIIGSINPQKSQNTETSSKSTSSNVTDFAEASFKKRFFEGCQSGGAYEAQCNCLYEAERAKYSLDERLQMVATYNKTKQSPQAISEIIKACAIKYPPQKLTSTPSPTPVIGLSITRSFIISGLEKVAPDIQFTQGVSYKGQDNYVASEGQNIIQLLGPSNNLNEISSTALLGDETGKNMIALVYIVGIPNIIDPDAGDWMTSAMKEAVAAKDQGETQFERSTVIHNRKYQLSISYKDSFRYASVSISN